MSLQRIIQIIHFNIPQAVKKGSYTLRVGYRSEHASKIGVMSTSNPWAVKCDRAALTHLPEELPGEYNMNYGLGYLPGYLNTEMYITKDVSDLDVYAVYCGYGTFHISSVEMIGNRNYLKTIFPVFMLLLLFTDAVVILIRKGKLLRRERVALVSSGEKLNTEPDILWKRILYNEIIVVIAIGLLSCIPLFFRCGILFDDGSFMYGRINGLAEGLIDGQFPVRIHPGTLNGYGYAVSYFYPDIFMYPFALLRVAGYSLRFCVYTMIVCINIGTAVAAYISTRRVFRDYRIACFCTFIYTFGLYRLLDVYARGAVAEAMAIVFLPLIVAGLYDVIVNDEKGAMLTIGLVGLVNTHVLSCEMAAVFIILVCIICAKQVFTVKHIKELIKSCVITMLLSMYFLFPFLHFSTTDSFKVYAQNAYETSANMLGLKDIFALFVIASISKARSNRLKSYRFTVLCFAFGVLALILSSSLFPWKAIENAGGILRTVFCMVQFPWRYLSIAMVMFTFAAGGAIGVIRKSHISVCVMQGVMCMFIFAQSLVLFSSIKNTAADNHLIYDGAAIAGSIMEGMGEYEPVNFYEGDRDCSVEELNYAINPDCNLNPVGDTAAGLTIGPLSKSGTKYTVLAINPTEQEQTLYMPITYYDGYRVSNVATSEAGDDPVPVLFETDFGTIGVRVPVGYYNGIHIEYRENMLYTAAEIISLITVLILVIICLGKFVSCHSAILRATTEETDIII